VLLGEEGRRCVARLNIVALPSAPDSPFAILLLPLLGVHPFMSSDDQPDERTQVVDRRLFVGYASAALDATGDPLEKEI